MSSKDCEDYMKDQVQQEVERLAKVARLASDIGMDPTAIEEVAALLQTHAHRHLEHGQDLPGTMPVRFGGQPDAEC
jgi:hypothetical protein